MINTPALAPNHPLLQDGFNDGFRAPDLGWVGRTKRRGAMRAEDFNSGANLYSNFWMGPADQAQAFAAQLVEEFQEWLEDVVPQDTGREAGPIVAVALWQDSATALGMVCVQSFTPDFQIDHVPEEFEAFNDYAAEMTQIMCDGSDNTPDEGLYGIGQLKATTLRPAMVACLISCVPAGQHDELRAREKLREQRRAEAAATPRMGP